MKFNKYANNAEILLIRSQRFSIQYFICRLHSNYQGKGYAKKAMNCILDYIYSYPCGKAEYCWLSYEPENTVAKSLYQSLGFEETGEYDGEEIISIKKL